MAHVIFHQDARHPMPAEFGREESGEAPSFFKNQIVGLGRLSTELGKPTEIGNMGKDIQSAGRYIILSLRSPLHLGLNRNHLKFVALERLPDSAKD
jgi:hypothetical protein